MDPESEEESPGEEEDEASDDEMNGDVVEGSVVPFLDCFWNMSSTVRVCGWRGHARPDAHLARVGGSACMCACVCVCACVHA